MLLALFFIASAILLGWVLAKQFAFLDSFLKKTAFAIFAGLFFSTWLTLGLYWWIFNGLTQAKSSPQAYPPSPPQPYSSTFSKQNHALCALKRKQQLGLYA